MRPIRRCRVCGLYLEDDVHCGVECEVVMDGSRRVMLSRVVSAILRHLAPSLGLRVDVGGWVSIRELVSYLRERWPRRELYQWVTEEHVVALAALDPKGRFEVRDGLVRARYGHTFPVRLDLDEDWGVKVLYHGTQASNVGSIMAEGIKPMRRLYVHLSATPEDAIEVGRRRGPRVAVIVVDAECLRRLGHRVFRASHRVYLTDYVPPRCISGVRYVDDG